MWCKISSLRSPSSIYNSIVLLMAFVLNHLFYGELIIRLRKRDPYFSLKIMDNESLPFPVASGNRKRRGDTWPDPEASGQGGGMQGEVRGEVRKACCGELSLHSRFVVESLCNFSFFRGLWLELYI